jgi:hypothetical protein
MIGSVVVIDLRSPFVCIGTLAGQDEHYVVLEYGDIHDLRDSKTNRENYVVESRLTGIKRNRKRVLVALADVVAIAKFDDVLIAEEE